MANQSDSDTQITNQPKQSDTPAVRVVVVNYNAGPHLKRCMESLTQQSYSSFETVVIDNASTDDSLENALPDDPRFKLIQLDENIGFAAANNLGAQNSPATWLATLNPDAVAEPNWLEALLDATRRYPDVAMFGSTQIDAMNPNKLDGSGDAYFAFGLAWRGNYGHPLSDLPEEGETFSPCAAAAFYKTTVFHAAGGFDERFFCYLEDVDLAFRLRLKGERCIQVKDAVVRHVGSAISIPKSDFVRFHSARNNLWLFVKNMPGVLFWLLLPGHILLQVMWLMWAALRGHFGPVWRGFLAGFEALPAIWHERKTKPKLIRINIIRLLTAMTFSPIKLLKKENVTIKNTSFLRK